MDRDATGQGTAPLEQRSCLMRIILRRFMLLLCLVLMLVGRSAAQTGAETTYVVTLPAPEHHWLQVEATFRDLGAAPLRARMSRSSPGRYAVHEFAKNVFAI